MAHVTVGVEVGRQRDPLAIAVVEPERRADGHHFVVRHLDRIGHGKPALGRLHGEIENRVGLRGTECHYLVRYLERFPPRTSYPALADRAAQMSAGVAARTAAIAYLDLACALGVAVQIEPD